MWEEFDDVCRECRRGGASVSNNELDLCSNHHSNHQEGRTVVIISVVEHKTSREGHSKLLLSIDDYKWLRTYIVCSVHIPCHLAIV